MKKLYACILLGVLMIACQSLKKSTPAGVARNGVNIAYDICGDGDTTLLFIHGWCIDKSYWQSQADFFCPSYKVVRIDLPGFGASGKNRSAWNFEEYAADVKAVIDQLSLKNVILIGHSMSGDLILNVANKYPDLVAGIIGIDNLLEPSSPMTPEQAKENAAFFDTLRSAFDTTVNKYMAPALFKPTTDPRIVRRVMDNVFQADSSIAIKVLEGLVTIAQTEQTLMQGLNKKLFLVHSSVNPVKADSLNKYCKHGFQAEAVDATSHYPMIEKPAEFNQALQKVITAIGKKE